MSKFRLWIFQRYVLSNWTYIRVWDIEKCFFFNTSASAWDPKGRFNQPDLSLVTRAVETELTRRQSCFATNWAISYTTHSYRNRAISEMRYKFGSVVVVVVVVVVDIFVLMFFVFQYLQIYKSFSVSKSLFQLLRLPVLQYNKVIDPNTQMFKNEISQNCFGIHY